MQVLEISALTVGLFLFFSCFRCSGQHGVGRIDIVENRFVGLKSRGKFLPKFNIVIEIEFVKENTRLVFHYL